MKCEPCNGRGIYDLPPDHGEVECSACKGTGRQSKRRERK